MTGEEKEKIIKLCVKKAKGKCTVIAGTGSNCTATTVEATKKAQALGVDAVLIVNPYYNKPSQNGLYGHIKAIDQVGIPIVLYNIPGRSGVALTPQTIARVYNDCDNVIAVKDATGALDTAIEVRSLCDITILSGDDALALPMKAVGGSGVMSVTSNLHPTLMKSLCSEDMTKAADELRKNYKFIKSMFCEINPVPIKYALFKAGVITSPGVRQPLALLTEDNAKHITTILTEFNIT